MNTKLVKRLNAAVTTGMEGAGTLPAKDSVKIRPKDWHAICDLAKALYASSLESQCDCERLRAENARLREALKLHVEYGAVPRDRGGKSGPKGRAWAAFIEARDAALGGSDA